MLEFEHRSVSSVTEKDAGRKAFSAGKSVRDCPFCDQRRWAWLEGWHQEERARLAPLPSSPTSVAELLPD